MVIYNTIREHCIPHDIQIYLESHRDWNIVKYGHQSALADRCTTKRDYVARTGREISLSQYLVTAPPPLPSPGTFHNLRNFHEFP
jgi:hypothetical protein